MNQLNKLLLLFCSLLIRQAPLSAETILLYTQVNNPTDKHIGFAYKKHPDAESNSFFRLDLNAANEAQFQLELDAAKFVELHYGGQIVQLYLETNTQLQIYFDGRDLKNTIHFKGKGAGNNQVLADYHKRFRSSDKKEYEGGYLTVQVDKDIADKARSSTPSSFAQSNSIGQAEQVRFLESNRAQLSPFLYQYLQTEIQYASATNRIAWFLENQTASIQRPKSSIAVLEKASLQEYRLLSHPAYQNFLSAYVFYSFLPGDLSRYKVHIPFYEIIEKNFQGKVKYHLLTELLVNVYNRSGDAALAQKHFQAFANNNPYPEYTEKILEVYGGALSGTPNVGAPDFDMMTPERNVISLSDYNGKVVYVSFWASWCKPCIEGFKKSAATRQKLQEMGVILLNVSIDKKEEAWKEAMVRHNPIGINGLVLSLEDISKKYNISSIPIYEIIAKNGKFAYLSDSAQRNILEEFRQLVEK